MDPEEQENQEGKMESEKSESPAAPLMPYNLRDRTARRPPRSPSPEVVFMKRKKKNKRSSSIEPLPKNYAHPVPGALQISGRQVESKLGSRQPPLLSPKASRACRRVKSTKNRTETVPATGRQNRADPNAVRAVKFDVGPTLPMKLTEKNTQNSPRNTPSTLPSTSMTDPKIEKKVSLPQPPPDSGVRRLEDAENLQAILTASPAQGANTPTVGEFIELDNTLLLELLDYYGPPSPFPPIRMRIPESKNTNLLWEPHSSEDSTGAQFENDTNNSEDNVETAASPGKGLESPKTGEYYVPKRKRFRPVSKTVPKVGKNFGIFQPPSPSPLDSEGLLLVQNTENYENLVLTTHPEEPRDPPTTAEWYNDCTLFKIDKALELAVFNLSEKKKFLGLSPTFDENPKRNAELLYQKAILNPNHVHPQVLEMVERMQTMNRGTYETYE